MVSNECFPLGMEKSVEVGQHVCLHMLHIRYVCILESPAVGSFCQKQRLICHLRRPSYM